MLASQSWTEKRAYLALKLSEEISSSSSLSILSQPNECISLFCHYLSKEDIAQFKLSCRQICIVCLEHMNKIKIGAFDLNSVLYTEKYVNLNAMEKEFEYSYYPSTKKFETLCIEWEKKYKIPSEHQIIFAYTAPIEKIYPLDDESEDELFMNEDPMPILDLLCYEYPGVAEWIKTEEAAEYISTKYQLAHFLNGVIERQPQFKESVKFYKLQKRTKLLDKDKFDTIGDLTGLSEKANFLILDKRNIFIMVGDKAMPLTYNNVYEGIKDKLGLLTLLALEYFDLREQSLRIVQFVLRPQMVTYGQVMSYVKDYFEPTDGIDNTWYEELMDYDVEYEFYETDIDESMPKLYEIENEDDDEDEDFCNQSVDTNKITFQYAPTLALKTKLQLHNKVIECKFLQKCFYLSARVFVSGIGSVTPPCAFQCQKDVLKECFKIYYADSKDKRDLQRMCTLIDKFELSKCKIKIEKCAFSGLLKMKIAEKFDNIIDAKYIELFTMVANRGGDDLLAAISRIDNWQRVRWEQPISSTIGFRFALAYYDTQTYDNTKDKLHMVRIFRPETCPHPFYDKYKGVASMFAFKKQNFKYGEFVQHILAHIKRSKDHLMYHYFKDLFDDSLQNGNNDDEKTMANDEDQSVSTFCLLALPPTGMKKNVNVKNFSFLNQKGSTNLNDKGGFDLFIHRNVSQKLSDRTLTIKFILERAKLNTKTNPKEMKKLKYVGFPLRASINKKSSLQDVIDEYLEDSKEYLTSCYRINIGKKIIAIPEKQRDHYRPYYEFMQTNPEDFIVFKVKGCPEIEHVYLPMYSNSGVL